MKKELKSVFVLFFVCIFSALMLSGVNILTKDRIKANNEKNENASLYSVFEDPVGFTRLELKNSPEAVVSLFSEDGGAGYAALVSTSSQYSTSPLNFTLGISRDGVIVGVTLTNYGETKSFGDYPDSFIGKNSALDGVMLFSGATYSSRAFYEACEDVFSVLIEMGLVSEGEKSEEAKILDTVKHALPGAVDENGVLKISELENKIDGVAKAYKADNDVGFAFVFEHNKEKLVLSLSTSGSMAVYNLDGDIVEPPNSAIIENIYSGTDILAFAENDLKYAKMIADDGEKLIGITPKNSFGVVSSVYRAESKYIFVCRPFGYSKPMTFMLQIENGRVTKFRNSGELIQGGQYYENFELDENAYRESIIGKGETETDDVIVSGATVTGNAVKRALGDAFAVYSEVINEAQ